jgi:hypothetical protein
MGLKKENDEYKVKRIEEIKKELIYYAKDLAHHKFCFNPIAFLITFRLYGGIFYSDAGENIIDDKLKELKKLTGYYTNEPKVFPLGKKYKFKEDEYVDIVEELYVKHFSITSGKFNYFWNIITEIFIEHYNETKKIINTNKNKRLCH